MADEHLDDEQWRALCLRYCGDICEWKAWLGADYGKRYLAESRLFNELLETTRDD